MKLTLKFKLPKDKDIEETISKHSLALNYVSESEFEIGGKITNPITLSKKYYYDIRERFGLPAQQAQSLFRDLSAKYKQVRTTKRKLKKAIHFNSTFFSIVRNRNFSFDPATGVFKVTTINGRKTYKVQISDYHKQYLDRIAQICDSTISIDRVKNKLYLNLTIEVPIDLISDNAKGETMGIDLGLTKLATCCTNKGKTLVIKGGIVKYHRNKFLNLRKRLQHKGTKSAKKLLKKLSGKENRWMRDVNYCAVKSIIQFAKENNISHIGIEDLTNIRTNKLRKETRREINSWAFYQFKEILNYKTKMEGISVILVDPKYTSQACSKCGFTSKDNRKTQKHFKCQSCNFSQNADINAASNIELLTRISRFNETSWGDINHPDVTDVDSKGLFRQLRTSLSYKLTSLSGE